MVNIIQHTNNRSINTLTLAVFHRNQPHLFGKIATNKRAKNVELKARSRNYCKRNDTTVGCVKLPPWSEATRKFNSSNIVSSFSSYSVP